VLAPIPRPLSSPPSMTPPPTVRIPSSARHLPTVVLGRCKRSRFLSAAAPTLAHVVYNWPITGEKHIPVNRYIATTSTSWPFFSTLPPILLSSPPSAFPGPSFSCSTLSPAYTGFFCFCFHVSTKQIAAIEDSKLSSVHKIDERYSKSLTLEQLSTIHKQSLMDVKIN
jgi:hypothetical protein